MWKETAFALVKAVLFLVIALFLLAGPLIGSTTDIYDIEPGAKGYAHVAASIFTTFIPSLAVDAALVGFFPSWRFLRVALPGVAALTLVAWACLVSLVFFGTFAKYPDDPIHPSLLAMAPIGIVAANAIIFLLTRARRPAAPVS